MVAHPTPGSSPTGLAAGDRFVEMVQNEYDRVTPEVSGTPAGHRGALPLAADVWGRASFADVTYYTAPSLAGVFATGTPGGSASWSVCR